MERYLRQESVFDQQRLKSCRIAVVGASQLTHYLCTYISGLGLGNVAIFDRGGSGFMCSRSKGLEERLKEMNPELNIDIFSRPFEPDFTGKINALLDFTNSPESKSITRDYAARKKLLYISASTSYDAGSIEIIQPKGRLAMLLSKNYNFAKYKSKKQGNFSSGLIAAMALDEVRKEVMPLGGDEKSDGIIEYNTFSSADICSKLRVSRSNTKALIVGAGGTGTYVALSLAQMGIEVSVYDGDTIEDTNLNRQVFYYGRVGKNKALTLKERLQGMFNCRIKAFDKKFTEEDAGSIKDYAAVFSCVDNPESRLMLSRESLRQKIPLIDTGVTAFSARVESFVPGGTCMECRRGASYQERVGETESCAAMDIPNVVMSNAFAGALACSIFSSITNNRIIYLSKLAGMGKFRIANVGNDSACGKSCECSCHKNKRRKDEERFNNKNFRAPQV